jgi:lariat debranching enzyme
MVFLHSGIIRPPGGRLFSLIATALTMQGERRGGGSGGGDGGGQRHYSRGGGRSWRGRGGNRGGGGGGRGGGGPHNNNNNHRRRPFSTIGAGGEDTTRIEEMGIRIPGETVAIAVEGCCHGKLDDIYARLAKQQIDLLICCGDFQSLRSTADYHSFAVPPKYHDLGSFYQYYTGEKVAPLLTIFVGGNHEASQPLQELYYGGWVAPNIYYLGAAGVVQYRGIRIGGLSGIYKGYDYTQSRYEVPPYDRSTMRSVYHYRNVETYRLQCLASAPQQRRLDVMISHDWPQGIEQYGDTAGLLRRKPFFQQEVQDNALGSPPAMQVLKTLRPIYWFAAHLHVKFTAQVKHDNNEVPQQKTASSSDPTVLVPAQTMTTTSSSQDQPPTQFLAPESSSLTCCGPGNPDLTDLMTQFLSLDKCLPRRHYLSIVHIPTTKSSSSLSESEEAKTSSPLLLQYDPEWLAILQHTHELSRSNRKERVRVPDTLYRVTDAELLDIMERFNHDFTIPTKDLAPTVPVETQTRGRPLPRMGHPQTDSFLQRLGLDHLPNLTIPYTPLMLDRTTTTAGVKQDCVNDVPIADDNEIMLEESSSGDEAEAVPNTRVEDRDVDAVPVDDNNEIRLEESNSSIEEEAALTTATSTKIMREPKKPKMDE